MAIDYPTLRQWARRIGPAAVVAALSLSGSATAYAQTTVSLEDLRKVVDQQRALIDAQTARLDAQGRELADLRRRVDEVSAGAPGASQAPAIEQGAQRAPELPAAVVSAGEFPGSIRMPGTDTALKVGGQARMTLVNTLGPLGVDDRFITSSIPVEGTQTAGEESRTTYTPVATRVNLELRSPEPPRRSPHVPRMGLRRHREDRPAPSRVHAGAALDDRPDLVDVLGPRSRADRDRFRRVERDLAVQAAADPIHAADAPEPERLIRRREPRPRSHGSRGRERHARFHRPGTMGAGRRCARTASAWPHGPRAGCRSGARRCAASCRIGPRRPCRPAGSAST